MHTYVYFKRSKGAKNPQKLSTEILQSKHNKIQNPKDGFYTDYVDLKTRD